MERFIRRTRIPATAEQVYRWHAEPGTLERLTPPWEDARVMEDTGGIEQTGSRVTLCVRIGPFKQRWVAEHTASEPGRMFRDTMIRGPFPHWEHTHNFIPDRPVTPDGPGACWLEDCVEYVLPLGALGRLVAGWYVRRKLDRLFAYRHTVTREAFGARTQ
jgi:ligand-binding SRPBCC domain-containing protein